MQLSAYVLSVALSIAKTNLMASLRCNQTLGYFNKVFSRLRPSNPPTSGRREIRLQGKGGIRIVRILPADWASPVFVIRISPASKQHQQ